MTKSIFFFTTIFICRLVQAQVHVPLAIERYYEGRHRLTTVVDIRLFDLQEIALRKIDTVYIIRHPSSWEPGFPNACSFGDTLDLYCFDTKGRIVQYTYFQGRGDYSTTFRYDSLGNMLFREMYRRKGKDAGTKVYPTLPVDTTDWKTVTKTEKKGEDHLYTDIVFWRFKTGMDTAYIVSTRKDKNGRVHELSSRINKRYTGEIDDDTGELTYHYEYRYDNNGRLVYFLSYDYKDQPSTRTTISYPGYGQIIESYNAATNRLAYTEVLLKSVTKDVVTLTNQNSQITLTPLEKGSRLYKLKTVSTSHEFPYIEYYEISYH